MRGFSRKKYGTERVVSRVIGELLHSPMYVEWVLMSRGKKGAFKKKIRKILREELLGDVLLESIARSILKDGSVDIESPLYMYVRKYVYRGDVRRMLAEMQEVIENAG